MIKQCRYLNLYASILFVSYANSTAIDVVFNTLLQFNIPYFHLIMLSTRWFPPCSLLVSVINSKYACDDYWIIARRFCSCNNSENCRRSPTLVIPFLSNYGWRLANLWLWFNWLFCSNSFIAAPQVAFWWLLIV